MGIFMNETKTYKRISKPTSLHISDLHIRDDSPIGRIDNFQEKQDIKMDFIFWLAYNYNIPIFIAGDIGHRSKWSCKLLEWFIRKQRKYNIKIYCIPGQHDLNAHSLLSWRESAIGVLHAAGAIILLGINELQSYIELDNFCVHAFPWGSSLSHPENCNNKPQIALIHQMILSDESSKEEWNQNSPIGHKLLKDFPEFSIIHSGDNHISFTLEYEKRYLINAGSVFRTTISQQDHKPKVYLWYAEEKRVKPVYLPIEENVFDMNYIEKNEHDKVKEVRFESLITAVKNTVELGIKFETNVENYLQQNRTEKSVTEEIWKYVK